MAVETKPSIGIVLESAVNVDGVHSPNGRSAILSDNAAAVAINAVYYPRRTEGMVRVDLARRGIAPEHHEIILGALVEAKSEIAEAQSKSGNGQKAGK